MNDEQIKIIREFFKTKVKENLSELEKDILDTTDEILKEPIDYNSARFRMSVNYEKYEIVSWIQATQPQAKIKTQLTPEEIKDNLIVQLSYLCNRYMAR